MNYKDYIKQNNINLSITFEEFLQLKHSEHYMGTDDDMPDKYELWLEMQDLIELAEEWNKDSIRLAEESLVRKVVEDVQKSSENKFFKASQEYTERVDGYEEAIVDILSLPVLSINKQKDE